MEREFVRIEKLQGRLRENMEVYEGLRRSVDKMNQDTIKEKTEQ